MNKSSHAGILDTMVLEQPARNVKLIGPNLKVKLESVKGLYVLSPVKVPR